MNPLPLPPTVTNDENSLLLLLASNDDDDDWKTCCSNVSAQTESSNHHDLNREMIEISIPKKWIIESTEIHSNAFWFDSLSRLVTFFLFLTILNCRQIKSLFRLIIKICYWQDTQVLHTYYFDEKKEKKERGERERSERVNCERMEWNQNKLLVRHAHRISLLLPPLPTNFLHLSDVSLSSSFSRPLSAKERKVRISIEIYWFSGVKNGKVWIE